MRAQEFVWTTLSTIGLAVTLDSARADEPVSTPRPWSLLVYCAIDNNADGPCQEFLGTVRRAIDDDPSLDVVVLLDRSDGHSEESTLVGEDFTGCRLYRLKSDSRAVNIFPN
jgi:hypothetical protein